MRKLVLGLAAAAALSVASGANATILVASATGVAPSALPVGTQGTLLASQSFTGTAFTFSGTFNQAVYRNTLGTLDFYFQVLRTGAGSVSDNPIQSFTVANYGNFVVDVFTVLTDPDAGGIFVAANNGTPVTTFGRTSDGNVLSANFGANPLTGTENSETVIYRTSATTYGLGTFGVIDGSTLQGLTYAPAVPEPATWALMLLGFGGIGLAMRRRRKPALAQLA